MLSSPTGQVFHHCTQDQAIDTFYTWSNSEQWNPSRKGYEHEVHHNIDPKGFIYSTVESSPSDNNQVEEQGQKGKEKETKKQGPDPAKNEIVCIVSAIRYGEDQGWIGHYIASSKFRGRGYGLATFNKALDHLNHETRASIGLDGVMAQLENYRKSGFTQSAWLNERRNGSVTELVEKKERELAERISHNKVEGLVLLSDPNVDLEQLPGIEVKYCGMKRPQFVKKWVQFHANHPEENRVGVAFLSSDPTSTDPVTGKPLVLGYACVRPATSSYRVGPLYASSGEIAKILLVKLAVEVLQAEKQHPLGIPMVFDVDMPDKNPAAVELFNGLGWKNTFPCMRMWKGKVPEHDVNGVFGVTSLEVG
ncbi:hypothetical protein BGZ95_000734 [Linnemannia exigua]|uniref:YitH/HolE acetyltransferase (GNAT) domain-containing protein n=1 Tax=Linnemannia exigua TaxID=604196 RepID=A0AAD4H451_9FUNG|nr:hypothetical protein BGZ95_000734 [Linnemannia exigua]